MTVEKNIEDLLRVSIKSDNPHFIFITGSAGTGKTTLVKKLRKEFKKSATVAFTGVAALTCGGQTIHSLFDFKVGTPLSKLAKKNKKVKRLNKKVIKNLELLIIDEISMVSAPLLDGISETLKLIKKNEESFGGITILASGDLCQLSPVINTEQEKQLKKLPYTSGYFFSSNSLSEIGQAGRFHPIELKKNYRHQQDDVYLALLNRFRKQDRMDDLIDQFNAHCYKDVTDGDANLVLSDVVKKVKKINEDGLNKLEAKIMTYPAKSMTGTFQKMSEKKLPAPSELKLKIQAKVIMTRNDPRGRWVNGNSGVIIGLDDDAIKVKIGKFVRKVERETWEDIVSEEYEGELIEVTKGRFEQFPITLGWAVTIHKAQGLTLDSYVIDMAGTAFAHGQMYVALSRGKRLKDLKFKNPISIDDCQFDSEVRDFLNSVNFKELNDSESEQQETAQTNQSETVTLLDAEVLRDYDDGILRTDIDKLERRVKALEERRIEVEKEETAIETSTDDQVNITHEDIKKLTYEELLKNVDKDDYDKLNELRKKLADKYGLESAHIVHAKSIMAMILFKPRTEQDFNKIHGIGEKFLNNYLEAFSELINEMYPEKEVAAKEKQRSTIATYETSVPINRDFGAKRIIEVKKQIKKTIKDVLKEEYEIQMVLIQNGCFFEMIEEDAVYFHSEFEFKPGLQNGAGFGQEGLGKYILKLDQRNVCYAVVEQVSEVGPGPVGSGPKMKRQVTRVGTNCNKKASKALGLIFQNV